jgi:hypothetical protein
MGVAMTDVEDHNFEIVSAAKVFSDPKSNRDIIILLNQVAYMLDAHQFESLLHPEQGTIIFS